MNPQTWWFLARASGLVAWGLLATSVLSGLLLATRLTGKHPPPAWTLDLHRFLGALAVSFTGLHLASLIADDYVRFNLLDLLVPYATSWRPGAVALGVVALYLLVAVQVSSLLMRRIPRSRWRLIHLSSYAAFWLATFHLLLAGTDATNVLVRWMVNIVTAVVVFLTLVRVLSSHRQRPARHPGLQTRSANRPVSQSVGLASGPG